LRYKVGQIVTTAKDIEVEMELSEEKRIIPINAKGIIGADKHLHYFSKCDFIRPISKNNEVKGYDAHGIAEYLYYLLDADFLMDDILEDNSIEKEDFIASIEFALIEIGMY